MTSSSPTEDLSLPRLYLQLEYGDRASSILGVSTIATQAEIRDAYHAIALRIHPDKAPTEELREYHTSLFQRVHNAYQRLSKSQSKPLGEDDLANLPPKQLPETWASLHARNLEFKEKLQQERKRALKTKRAEDERRLARLANLKAKNARLAANRLERARLKVEARLEREMKTSVREKKKAGDLATKAPLFKSPATHFDAEEWQQEEEAGTKPPGADEPATDSGIETLEQQDLDDWEQNQDSLRGDAKPTKLKHRKPPQNRPTARIATPMDTKAYINKPLCSAEDIQHRWDKQLLSGSRSGSVSLAEKKRREDSVLAAMLKKRIMLCAYADGVLKGIVNRKRVSLSPAEKMGLEDDLLQEALVGMEHRAEKMTDRLLQLMDRDVVEQYYLEDGSLPVEGTALATLMIEEN